MKNSWLYKLIGAFLLIILIGGVITSLLISRATLRAFELYTTRSGEIWAQRLAPQLSEYYQQNGNWSDITSWFQTNPLFSVGNGETQLPMMGQGNGQGFGQGANKGPMYGSMIGVLDQRMILADAVGRIIYDSAYDLINKQLTASELENGTPVEVDGVQVGTFFLTPADNSSLRTPATEFQSSVQKTIIYSTILAGVIALVLGAILFYQMTAPMRQLNKAAMSLSSGDFSDRIKVTGSDELAELGKAFNHMAESLQVAEQQRQNMMADIAHELRTPLTAIQGTIEAMQDGILPCDHDQLEALVSETNILNRLIDDLRLLTLAETHHLKLELQEIDLNTLISKVIEGLRPLALTKNIDLRFATFGPPPRLLIDPDRITQVINNLVSNAIRYTPQDGHVQIEIGPLLETDRVAISVSDNGSGIRKEDLHHVFDRFYRPDKSRSRGSGGSGLGLAIVKSLIEAHDGGVSVESPIAQSASGLPIGTRFTIDLPIKKKSSVSHRA